MIVVRNEDTGCRCAALFVVAATQRLASLARHLNVAHSRCREFITDNLVVKIFCKLHTSVISYLSQVICLLHWQTHYNSVKIHQLIKLPAVRV